MANREAFKLSTQKRGDKPAARTTIGFSALPEETVQIRARAAELELSVADYLRKLVFTDLSDTERSGAE